MQRHGTAYTLGQYTEVLVVVQRALPKALEGTNPKNLLPLLQKNGEKLEGGLGRLFRSLEDSTPQVVAMRSSRVTQRMFPVQLNYDESLEAKVATRFTYVNPNLTEANFPRVVGHGLVNEDAVLVNFGEYMESEGAIVSLDEMDLRAGVPKELADLSKAHPDSLEFAACLPVVALGESWQDPLGYRSVACLGGYASSRELYLDRWGGGWRDSWWFLAFRK